METLFRYIALLSISPVCENYSIEREQHYNITNGFNRSIIIVIKQNTLLSTYFNADTISNRSARGKKFFPFFRSNHESELTPTISLSPKFRAAFRYARCPECNGSKPPVTSTTVSISIEVEGYCKNYCCGYTKGTKNSIAQRLSLHLPVINSGKRVVLFVYFLARFHYRSPKMIAKAAHKWIISTDEN